MKCRYEKWGRERAASELPRASKKLISVNQHKRTMNPCFLQIHSQILSYTNQ